MNWLFWILGGLLLLPICIELIARVIVRTTPYRVFHPHRHDDLEIDLVTLPKLDPHAVFRVNAHGERGPERPKGSNGFRVLVAGGSAVECFFLDEPVSWPGALLKKLQSLPALNGRVVHVANVGKSGVDSGASKEMLFRLLAKDQSVDLLVIMVAASDVLRWLTLGAPADRGAVAMSIDECFDRNPEVELGFTPKKSALAMLYRWRRDSKPKLRKKTGHRYAINRAMRAGAKEIRTVVPPHDVVVERYAKNLGEALAFAKSRVKNVLFVRQSWFCKDQYLPEELAQFWGGSVGDPYLQHCSIFYSPEVFSALMNDIDKAAAKVVAEMGVAAVELRSVIPSSNENYVDQVHLTPAGSFLVADAVYDRIASDPSLVRSLA